MQFAYPAKLEQISTHKKAYFRLKISNSQKIVLKNIWFEFFDVLLVGYLKKVTRFKLQNVQFSNPEKSEKIYTQFYIHLKFSSVFNLYHHLLTYLSF